MILELTADNESQTAFEIQAYFNSTQSKHTRYIFLQTWIFALRTNYIHW